LFNKINVNIYNFNGNFFFKVLLKNKLPPLISFLVKCSRFSRDASQFSRYVSRFSRESLKHLGWNILLARSQRAYQRQLNCYYATCSYQQKVQITVGGEKMNHREC